MHWFEEKVLEWTAGQGLLEGDGRVLLAVSGGADSAAMLRAMEGLRRASRLEASFAVGHVNHCLRGEASDGDERFVQKLAGELGLEFYAAQADVRGYAEDNRLSIETAGRRLRRRELIRMARQAGCEAVATAHHRDDQAETLIHRLRRGTGFRGLAGIRPTAVLEGMRFVRPLLGVRRAEVLAYLQEGGFGWREDHTNADTQLTRNRIRHKLLPLLQAEAGGDMAERLANLAQNAEGLQRRVESAASAFVPVRQGGRVEMDCRAAAELSPLVLGEVLRRTLEELEIGLRDYTQRHYGRMGAMIRAGRRTAAHLPGGAEFAIRRGKVIIGRRQ